MNYNQDEIKELDGRRVAIRTTDCCDSYSTFFDTSLCCKTCYKEVPQGQGDGTQVIDIDTMEVIEAGTNYIYTLPK